LFETNTAGRLRYSRLVYIFTALSYHGSNIHWARQDKTQQAFQLAWTIGQHAEIDSLRGFDSDECPVGGLTPEGSITKERSSKTNTQSLHEMQGNVGSFDRGVLFSSAPSAYARDIRPSLVTIARSSLADGIEFLLD
jgi:hypothetical protein